MDKIEAPLAELQALAEHIKAVDKELSPKGFAMASDTRSRLQTADALIAQAESIDPNSRDATAWVKQATALSALLRAESKPVAQ